MIFFEFWIFVIITLASPGPGNVMTMQFGVSMGVRRAMFFVAGTTTSYGIVSYLVGSGFNILADDNETLVMILKVSAAMLMVSMLLYNHTRSHQKNASDSARSIKPRTLLIQGLLVPPLNPKAWTILILCWSVFAPKFEYSWQAQLFITGQQMLANIIFQFCWAYAGAYLGKKATFSSRMQAIMSLITATIVIALVFI